VGGWYDALIAAELSSGVGVILPAWVLLGHPSIASQAGQMRRIACMTGMLTTCRVMRRDQGLNLHADFEFRTLIQPQSHVVDLYADHLILEYMVIQ